MTEPAAKNLRFKREPQTVKLEKPFTRNLNKAQKRQILLCLWCRAEEDVGEGLAFGRCHKVTSED